MKVFCISFLLLLCSSLSFAQSWKDLLNKGNVEKAVSAVTGKVDLVGTWNYTGSAIEFESDNILKKASGKVAAATLEKKINDQLNKIGLKENAATLTFNADSTFVLATVNKNKSGKYTYDAEAKQINLEIVGGKAVSAAVNTTGNQFSFLFNADKLIDVVNFVSDKVPNSTLKSVASLINNYDGMNVGLNFTKE